MKPRQRGKAPRCFALPPTTTGTQARTGYPVHFCSVVVCIPERTLSVSNGIHQENRHFWRVCNKTHPATLATYLYIHIVHVLYLAQSLGLVIIFSRIHADPPSPWRAPACWPARRGSWDGSQRGPPLTPGSATSARTEMRAREVLFPIGEEGIGIGTNPVSYW